MDKAKVITDEVLERDSLFRKKYVEGARNFEVLSKKFAFLKIKTLKWFFYSLFSY
tara:strand:+ start:212 stop:376 length:165 start_codon:yes stop_codon:yes gene_type:complete